MTELNLRKNSGHMIVDENSSRRDFLKLMGGSLAAVLLPVCSVPVRASKQTPHGVTTNPPNFILIFADDLGYGDIRGFGLKESPCETPHLDRMAAEGAKLTSFYVPTPYCAPSRATILTGRYPFRNGVVHNPAPDAGINEVALAHSEITIAEALKSAGYSSMCIGKWHLGHTPEYLPRRQGFDEYYGILYSNDMRPVQLVENEKVVEYPVLQATLTKRYTDRALDFIERSAGAKRPFFLYLPHAMPHKPLAASEDFYTPDTPDDLYADVIRELDFSIGRVFEKLRQLGIDNDTFVIFTSDNGPWYGGSTGGLRGMKSKTWEGGLRVPMIARWPGRIPSGVVNDSVAGTIDVLPTVLKALGIDVPTDRVIDGKDIWPLLTSRDAESPHEAIFGMQGPNLVTLRSSRWRLHVRSPGPEPQRNENWVDPRGPDGVTIIAPYEQARPSAYPGVIGGDGPRNMMLFDIEADPAEQHDVSKQNPDVVKRLTAIYEKMLAEVPEFKRPAQFGQLRRITGGDLRYDK
ncbi:MAG TPA: sulfatase-like hydrolase/transferase [Sedimentisphaerales bacterium]|nr:sulfatase-like hydrolase/transferase [Sedimentisphaerales bacterium]